MPPRLLWRSQAFQCFQVETWGLLSLITALIPFFLELAWLIPRQSQIAIMFWEPEGQEGYLELYVVSLACNSNKHNPSACLIQERASFVGRTQLTNGLCSKICLWSAVRNIEAEPHNNLLMEGRASHGRLIGFSFPPLAPLSVLET